MLPDSLMVPALVPRRQTPDSSLLSVMIHGGMPEENVRHNIKLTISGGQNEPRMAIACCVWALLTHPADSPEASFAIYYQPLEEAGGDFYDVVPIDAEVYGYFVADVSGHGVTAAFLTSAIIE